MNNELAAFVVQHPSVTTAWIEEQRKVQIKALSAATDMVLVHRAQGAIQLLDRMLALVEKANSLR